MTRQKGRVVVTGVTSAAKAGKPVRLHFRPSGGRVVARGTVAADGSFTVSAPLPAKKWRSARHADRARYRASVPGVGATPWLKLGHPPALGQGRRRPVPPPPGGTGRPSLSGC